MLAALLLRSATIAASAKAVTPKLRAETLPEGAGLGEEAFRFGRVVARLFLEFTQDVALAAGEIDRRFDRHLDVHVTRLMGSQHRHSLAFEAELLARLGAFGNCYPRLLAVDRRHLDLAAERGGGHRDRHFAEEIGTVALEEFVRSDR